MVVGSAPNFPFGSIDPIHDMGEITKEKSVLLHVDACVGGFILPFFEQLGKKVPTYDFREEAVTSISMDVHKYGYALKGSSVLLFQNPEMKNYSNYINISWPSYIFVNTSILSSRSVGPMASAWAVISYLGMDGYLNLTKKVLSARDFIYREMNKLGFRTTSPIESSILSLYNNDIDLFNFVVQMHKRSWYIEIQKSIPELVPYNLHMTLTPIHDDVSKSFIKDVKETLKLPADAEFNALMNDISSGNLDNISRMVKEGTLNTVMLIKLLELIPEDFAKEAANQLVNEMFR